MEPGVYDDLGFLVWMPNLREIEIALADLSNMPNLKELKHLEKVWVSDCRMENLNWLEGTTIVHFLFNGSGDQDFSPLTAEDQAFAIEILQGIWME